MEFLLVDEIDVVRSNIRRLIRSQTTFRVDKKPLALADTKTVRDRSDS